MTLNKNVVVNQAWNEFAINLFIGLVLLPVAFVFSIRMFPLYLWLPAPDWAVRGVAYAYFISLCLQILPTIPPILRWSSQIPFYLSSLGQMLKGGVILWFVWKLDTLTHRRDPWTVHRKTAPGPGSTAYPRGLTRLRRIRPLWAITVCGLHLVSLWCLYRDAYGYFKSHRVDYPHQQRCTTPHLFVRIHNPFDSRYVGTDDSRIHQKEESCELKTGGCHFLVWYYCSFKSSRAVNYTCITFANHLRKYFYFAKSSRSLWTIRIIDCYLFGGKSH